MAYYNYKRSRHGGYSRSVGHERALQHIHEAEELSRELGGTDKDVKAYFFNLPKSKLKSILDIYENKYGFSKREYAEDTFNDWKYGRRKMSGLVAGRLFNLLPPRMPLKDKHSLVEKLWEKYCPKSNKALLVGPNAKEEEISNSIRSHLMEVVKEYQIPEPLERRFQWLSAGDVNVQQQLLNYFLQREKDLITQGMKDRVPVLLGHLREHGSNTQKLEQNITIGKHSLDIHFNSKNNGVRFVEPSSHKIHGSKSSTGKWIWKIVGWGIFAIIMLRACYG